jgi:hypothetical protein
MKRIIRKRNPKTMIATAFLAGILTVAGCTTSNAPINSASQADTGTQNAAGASHFLNEYYNTLVEKSDEAKAATTKVEKVMVDTLGKEGYEKLGKTKNPHEALASLTEEQQKTLADGIQELNPLASHYDYSNISSDADRAYLNLISMASSSMLSGTGKNYKVEVSVPENKVRMNGNHASIDFQDVVFKLNGQQQPTGTDNTGMTAVVLTYVDGKWKINGEEMLRNLKNAAANTPNSSPSASSTNE